MDDNNTTRMPNSGGYDASNDTSGEYDTSNDYRQNSSPAPAPASGTTFNLNDPQQRAQAQQWLQQFQQQQGSGNTQRLPHEDLGHLAHQWAGQAEPQHVEDATTQAVQQMPPQQRAGFAQAITSFLQQHGITPSQVGVQTNNPQQMSPQDVGRMVGYAQQQNPDIIKQLLGPGGALNNPAVQVGIAGALAFALSRMSQKH